MPSTSCRVLEQLRYALCGTRLKLLCEPLQLIATSNKSRLGLRKRRHANNYVLSIAMGEVGMSFLVLIYKDIDHAVHAFFLLSLSRGLPRRPSIVIFDYHTFRARSNPPQYEIALPCTSQLRRRSSHIGASRDMLSLARPTASSTNTSSRKYFTPLPNQSILKFCNNHISLTHAHTALQLPRRPTTRRNQHNRISPLIPFLHLECRRLRLLRGQPTGTTEYLQACLRHAKNIQSSQSRAPGRNSLLRGFLQVLWWPDLKFRLVSVGAAVCGARRAGFDIAEWGG